MPTLCCSVLELRQYTLYPGKRDVLIELFEREFVESHEAVGMRLVGIIGPIPAALAVAVAGEAAADAVGADAGEAEAAAVSAPAGTAERAQAHAAHARAGEAAERVAGAAR